MIYLFLMPLKVVHMTLQYYFIRTNFALAISGTHSTVHTPAHLGHAFLYAIATSCNVM